MKYLKNVLLATGLVATTLGMSLSANAGAIIQQDIIADIEFANPNFFNIMEGADQLIGSITYNTDRADGAGFLETDSTVLELNIGNLMLTLSDAFSAIDDPQVLIGGFNPLNITSGLEFFSDEFVLFDDAGTEFSLVLDVGPLSSGSLLLENFGIFDLDAAGDVRLGNVTYVPEPSVLVLMLAGLGLLVRRKVAAK